MGAVTNPAACPDRQSSVARRIHSMIAGAALLEGWPGTAGTPSGL